MWDGCLGMDGMDLWGLRGMEHFTVLKKRYYLALPHSQNANMLCYVYTSTLKCHYFIFT